VNRPLIVGAFVIAGLALFTTGLFMIGNRHEAFARHVELYAEFANLSGITQGAKVQVAGMDAGQVQGVEIPDAPPAKFRVKIRLTEKLRGLVRTDSVVTIGTEGVVGNRFLAISAGTARAPVAAPGATLAGVEPTDISALLDQAKGAIGNIDTTVLNANNLVTNANGLITTLGGNLNSTVTEVKTTVSNANELIAGIKEGRGPAGMLLRDEALADQVRQAVTNIQGATGELKSAAANAATLVSDLQSKGFPQKVDDTLTEVHQTAKNFNAASAQVRQVVADLTGPDQDGATVVATIRESLSNVNVAAVNMADETEALKHNFLLRGFFRKRGYYTLTALSPDMYRKDPLFAATNTDRAWLSADQLFRPDSHGIEELTSQGRSALNLALGNYGQRIFQGPVVVEGYSDCEIVGDRLAASRSRAILVRNYLQSHFHLDTGKLGAVALESRPRDPSPHTSWNGVAITLLKAKQ
jgi:phospholipid/cholesterol/gamma-HCH transport system substrate-binding protein